MSENPVGPSSAAAAVDPDTAARLLSGTYHDPHAILGAHPTPRGTVLRALKPGATAVAAVIGGEHYPMARIQGSLWGTEVPISDPADYRYEVLYPTGSAIVADGYRFLPTIGELDQHLIAVLQARQFLVDERLDAVRMVTVRLCGGKHGQADAAAPTVRRHVGREGISASSAPANAAILEAGVGELCRSLNGNEQEEGRKGSHTDRRGDGRAFRKLPNT